MGSGISSVQKPVVMDAKFLEDRIVKDIARIEGLNPSHLQELIDLDGLEKSLVLSIQLEQQKLLNIANLWKMTLLTKIEMANNYIEEIEGLENLSNLQHLDLSFNCIKTIKGLDGLINLTYLNLSSNEISILENMENLKKLESFLIRHNKLKLFDDVFYLAQFENLLCLGIGENPLIRSESSHLNIIAILPQLKFLDFQMITEKELQEALLKYPFESKSNESAVPGTDQFISLNDESFHSLLGTDISDKEAFVEGLANGRGFEVLLECDKNFNMLLTYPPVSEMTDEFCRKISKWFDKWHVQGREYYKQMQEEKVAFLKQVEEAQHFTLSLLEEEEYKYTIFKEEIPKELCLIYQKNISPEQKDREIERLKEKCHNELTKTHKYLMNASTLCVDLVYEMGEIFKQEISKITGQYMKDVQNFFYKIMEIDGIYISRIMEFYFNIFDVGSNCDLETVDQAGKTYYPDPAFLQLLKEKSLVEMALMMAKTKHSALLQERMKNLKSSLQSFMLDTLKSVFECDVLVEQNEQIRNIMVFCNKQKYIIDELFSKNSTFRYYLGYR